MPHLPVEISGADPRVVRPRDLRGRYALPAKELARLADAGALLHLAHGYYAVVPEHYRGTRWRPSIEAVGLAIAQADYGHEHVAGMGPTAARLLGAIPRALGVAVVAVPKQRPQLETAVGPVRFVTRDVRALDVQRTETELAAGWVTSAEQTVLDLADRPALGGLTTDDITAAIRRLVPDVDWARVGRLAREQRKRPAAVRAAWVVGVEPPVRVSRRVPAEGLTGAESSDPVTYGIA